MPPRLSYSAAGQRQGPEAWPELKGLPVRVGGCRQPGEVPEAVPG